MSSFCDKCGEQWKRPPRYLEKKEKEHKPSIGNKGYYEVCKDECPEREHLHLYCECGFWTCKDTKTEESKGRSLKVAGVPNKRLNR